MEYTQREQLNCFLVDTFNRILTCENRAMSTAGISNLSVKELHVIGYVDQLQKYNRNTMSQIAEKIGITLGALTTAVNAIVRKGYLARSYNETDRRRVYLSLTESGRHVNETHSAFHHDMVNGICEFMDDESIKVLASSLDKLATFFNSF